MKKEYISQLTMDAFYKDILRQMAQDRYKPDIVVGLLRGGAEMAIKFSHYLNVPCEVFKWQLRDGEVSNSCIAQVDTFFKNNLNKDILVVDDIFDTGQSLRAFDDVAKVQPLTGLITYAVCIENVAEDSPTIDYSARQINRTDEDQWFVFPCEEWWY